MNTDMNDNSDKHPPLDRSTHSVVWFCTQVGSTAWLLLAALVVGRNDVASGLLFASGFLMVSLWGLYLWRYGEHASIYANLQRTFAGDALVVMIVIVTVNWRGTSHPWPYWPPAVYLGAMVWARLVLKPILAAAQADDATDGPSPDH